MRGQYWPGRALIGCRSDGGGGGWAGAGRGPGLSVTRRSEESGRQSRVREPEQKKYYMRKKYTGGGKYTAEKYIFARKYQSKKYYMRKNTRQKKILYVKK